ncbi:P-loop containing nucleoside triphosphate hydrolase protein [Martensiomyces pterosporus]|nr:P-loop containing nucleoside triphosphate hydrolase protein [Martensiomyces pterosporus]
MSTPKILRAGQQAYLHSSRTAFYSRFLHSSSSTGAPKTLGHQPLKSPSALQRLRSVKNRSATVLAGGHHNCAQTRQYAISTRAAKLKAPQCPTCGAAFQTERPGAPGYLNEQKWKQVNQSNLAQGSAVPSLESQDRPTEIPAFTDHKAEREAGGSGEKVLSEQEYSDIVANLDDPELKSIFTGEVEEPTSDNPSAPGSDAAETGKEPASKVESYEAMVAARLRRRGEQGRDRIVCQRCHTLKHYNRMDHPWKEDIVSDPRALKFLRYRTNLVVVVVCDLFDIPGSLIPHLGEFIGERHPVVLVANKADLLPKDYHQERVKTWLKRFVKELDINVQSIHLISAQKNIGTRELAADITERRRAGQDIYMVGRANVGKSELLNALLRISIGGSKHKVLSSHVPGTTMGLYGVPLRHFVKALVPVEGARPQDRQTNLYDTPGIFSTKSIITFLGNDELKMAMVSKRITPFTFLLNRNQSVMLGGLGRVDLVDGPDKVYVTVFASVRPHITRIERAEELMKKLEAGERTILQPPIGDSERLKNFPKHKLALEHTFEGVHRRMASVDVAFAGIGWVAITGLFPKATIRVYTPFGTGACVRPPMMPFEYKRLSPRMSSMRKTPK